MPTSSPSKRTKYFTPDQANQTLPLVRAIVGDIVELYRDVHERRERLVKIRQLPGASSRNEESVYSEELRHIEEEIDKDIDRLSDFAKELSSLGVDLKDPTVGLVDFPARLDGRDVCLCWKLGEDDVAWWHETDAGYQGRQSLYELSLPETEAASDGQNQ